MSLQPEISQFVVACGGEDSGPMWESDKDINQLALLTAEHTSFFDWTETVKYSEIILEIIIMHSLKKSSNILSCTPGFISVF